MSRSTFSFVTSRRSRSISICSGFIWPCPGNAYTGLALNSLTQRRSMFSPIPKSREACTTDTSRSRTNPTASALNSRPKVVVPLALFVSSNTKPCVRENRQQLSPTCDQRRPP
jgi:hypothetical protein